MSLCQPFHFGKRPRHRADQPSDGSCNLSAFVEQKDFVWGLIASMYLSSVVGFIIVLNTVPFWAAIALVLERAWPHKLAIDKTAEIGRH